MSMMSILLGNGGKGRVAISLTATGNNYDVYTNRGPSYVAGSSDITVTVAAPTIIGSSSTGAYAMLVPNSFNPTDTISIVNNGVIQGAGGGGGSGGNGYGSQTPGSSGGNAIYVNRPVTITNNGTIAGGGGGGGGGAGLVGTTPGATSKNPPTPYQYIGGGGGGGAGTIGGAGGSPNGGAGTSTTGGSGGGGSGPGAVAGGPGGGRGAAGTGVSGTSGGAAGNYIVGNSFVTWPTTGTRQGGVA